MQGAARARGIPYLDMVRGAQGSADEVSLSGFGARVSTC